MHKQNYDIYLKSNKKNKKFLYLIQLIDNNNQNNK